MPNIRRPPDSDYILYKHSVATQDSALKGWWPKFVLTVVVLFAIFGLIMPMIPSGKQSAADEDL